MTKSQKAFAARTTAAPVKQLDFQTRQTSVCLYCTDERKLQFKIPFTYYTNTNADTFDSC